MSLPKYAEYKDSGYTWLGQVPKHWVVGSLKRMLDIQNGADHKTIEAEEGVPVIGSGGPFTFASDYLYDGESVLLGRKGTIDKPLYVTGKFWTVDTMYWSKILPGTYGKFAYYAALTLPFDYYSTSTALPSMTKGVLGAHLVACPPFDEQAKIATFLDFETGKIDELIAEQEKLIVLLAEKRQATIFHAVTRGINPEAPMTDSGIAWLGEVPKHWDVKRLKNISRFVTVGIVVNPSEYVSDEGLPFIYGGDIAEGVISTESCRRISAEDSARQNKTRLEAGDLLTVRVGAPGITAVVPESCAGGNCASVMHIRRGTFDSAWLCYAMNSRMVRFQVEIVQYGAAQEQFNIGHAINFLIAVPPRREQSQISEYIASESIRLNRLSADAARAIRLLKERRSALIAAAVTGQIDVRGVLRKPVQLEEFEV